MREQCDSVKEVAHSDEPCESAAHLRFKELYNEF